MTKKQYLDLLKVRCDYCDGTGGGTERGQWYDCSDCGGAGSVPTELGKAILHLVEINLKTLMKAIDEDKCPPVSRP
jgi:DnaJ-class molecular chaperone